MADVEAADRVAAVTGSLGHAIRRERVLPVELARASITFFAIAIASDDDYANDATPPGSGRDGGPDVAVRRIA